MITTAANITTTIGSAIKNHSRNVIGSPVSPSSSSRPIRFGGLPIGRRRPPTVMPYVITSMRAAPKRSRSGSRSPSA